MKNAKRKREIFKKKRASCFACLIHDEMFHDFTSLFIAFDSSHKVINHFFRAPEVLDPLRHYTTCIYEFHSFFLRLLITMTISEERERRKKRRAFLSDTT